MTRHQLKQMRVNLGARARARATQAESRERLELKPRSTNEATGVPPVASARARTLAPTRKSELWQRRAGVVIGNRSPARIGAYHSIFGRTECAPTTLVGRNRDAVTKYWVPASERVKAKMYPFLPGKLLATANRLSIRQAVAGVLEHGREPSRDCKSGAYLIFCPKFA
jgi:hypothetical protein